jgi:hypothetical protein
VVAVSDRAPTCGGVSPLTAPDAPVDTPERSGIEPDRAGTDHVPGEQTPVDLDADTRVVRDDAPPSGQEPEQEERLERLRKVFGCVSEELDLRVSKEVAKNAQPGDVTLQVHKIDYHRLGAVHRLGLWLRAEESRPPDQQTRRYPTGFHGLHR